MATQKTTAVRASVFMDALEEGFMPRALSRQGLESTSSNAYEVVKLLEEGFLG
jgi:hypothetical protein